jgi:cell pole-organizing protein PopZ
MEEILASIRRIIADEPTKISRTEGPRNEGPRDEGLRSESASYESSRRQSATRSMAQHEDAPAARGPILPQPASNPATQEEEIDAMLARLRAGLHRAPPVLEEPTSDILDLTEQIGAAQSLPAAELAVADDLAQPDDEEETPAETPAESHPAAVTRAGGEPYGDVGDRVRDVDRESERAAARDVTEQGLISAATTAAVDSAFNALAQTVLVQNGRTLEDLVRELLRPMLKTWLDDNLPSMVERLVRAEIERVSRGRG